MAKKITDFEIINKVMIFDREVYRILEHTGKKYQFNKESQIKSALGDCEMLLVMSIDTPANSQSDLDSKIKMLTQSFSMLRFCELQFYRLNNSRRILATLVVS